MDLAEIKLSSPEVSDHEGDTFEDASDTKADGPNHGRSSSTASQRSLTDHRTSSSSSSSSSRSLTDPKQASTPVRSSALDMPAEASPEELTPRPSKVQPAGEEKERDVEELPSPQDTATGQEGTSHSAPQTAKYDHTAFDDIQLSEKAQAEAKEVQESKEAAEALEEAAQKAEAAEQRGRSTTTSSNNSSRSQSRSSNPLSQFPFGRTTSTDGKALPSVMSRKFASPFAWLSRKKTSPHPESSPPAPANRRRGTTQPAIGTAPDLMLRRLDEDKILDSRLPAKEQLKERFKMLRMRDEAGIPINQLPDGSRGSVASAGSAANCTHSRSNSRSESDVGLGIGLDGAKAAPDADSQTATSTATPASIPTSPTHTQPPRPPTADGAKSRSSSVMSAGGRSAHHAVDPSLAPGTVCGLHAGPSAMQDPEAPVDWDLWQAVVYEGPGAVAKTSAAELGRAIASGIPSAIRGVVWQVLAGSKNEELEGVYRELVARGADKEIAPSPQLASGGAAATTAAPANASASGSAPHSANSLASADSAHKDSIASSASSEHSVNSTPATTNGMTSPVHATMAAAAGLDGGADVAKAAAAVSAERAKKAKEELAALRKLEKAIRKDLGSRANYSKYAAATGMQEALFGVCKAYALFDEAVGYAQGMNFIVMPLLFSMPEEEAFGLLVKLMNQYHLREFFIEGMPGLHLALYQFERLLEDLEPALCYHLHRRGVTPSLYATQWFLTLFAYRFPLQLVLRVYDLVLSEGLPSAILKFALALLQRNAAALLALPDMAALKTFLAERVFDAYLDRAPTPASRLESGFFGSSAAGADREVYRADLLVQDAAAVPVSADALKEYADEYAARAKLEREREAELEGLRGANTALALRVRALEGRVEKTDADHVQLAGEMIRSKVETEEVRAKHAELEREATELKRVVARQPSEVEARLKEEMDRIMSRNIEVQNENRALEEAMAEMEKDLVETKMRFAEINGEYDGLKQKWADLRRALGE